ncbi:MAG: response regulator [Flavobacterium sp.]|uniref:response regulator n=1 Tax=Flavobacterium sp. TaxID=239 RepID=UPI001B10BCD0|nr:response regulator [Flavobacterium sp.]MBO9584440.1 response regulator [Flavobacterium sp.]
MHTKIILLIDDDCDDREFFTEAFSGLKNAFTLLCAEGGTRALEMLSDMDIQPMLIILDAGMPAMNGWECLKLLKSDSRFAHLPVIMASTSSRLIGIEEARDLGAVAYMVKPWDFNDLKLMIEIICSGLDGTLQEKLLHLQAAMPNNVFVFSKAYKNSIF